jgi:PEP-CTERM motif-containing protein
MGMIKRAIAATCTGALLALALVSGMTERAEAGPATVTLAGTIDGSVDGTSLADNTPFTVIASFRPSANLAGGGYGAYADPGLTFIIDSNTYVVAPNPSLLLVTIDPPIDVGLGIYGVSIPSQTGPLNVFFDAATTTVTIGGSMQTVYSDLTTYQQPSPFTESLVGGGTLFVTNFDSLDPTATETVPEPATLALLGVGLATTVPLRRRRHRRG